VNRSRFNKLAEAVYDRIAEAGGHFDITKVVDEIARELSSEDASSELIREFAQSLAERADDRRARRAESGQMDLLTGEVEALDAVWRLGGGRRVRVRDATRDDVLLWLEIRGHNAERVAAAYEKDRQVVVELLAFMTDEHMTVPQAIEARKAAQ
jgi:hypothetical protein